MTELQNVQVDLKNPSAIVIDQAAKILRDGNLVVAPTETRYGLLARVDSESAVEKLFEAKNRNANKPSAIFVPNITELEKLAEFTNTAKIIAQRFLPGPITLVMKAKRDFGPLFTRNGLTGFRISSSPIVSSIIEKSGLLLSATSANVTGEPAPDNIVEISEQLGEKVDLYIDAGPLNNPASTVVQVLENDITIIRAGAISESEIRKTIS